MKNAAKLKEDCIRLLTAIHKADRDGGGFVTLALTIVNEFAPQLKGGFFLHRDGYFEFLLFSEMKEHKVLDLFCETYLVKQ
jgi:hypothetical protein